MLKKYEQEQNGMMKAMTCTKEALPAEHQAESPEKKQLRNKEKHTPRSSLWRFGSTSAEA